MATKSAFYLLLPMLAFAVGMLLPVQAGVNAQLKTFLGHPLQAALVSFLVGTALLIVVALLTRMPLPTGKIVSGIPWWAWVGGGFCGAIYITMVILLTPRLGATTTFGLIIAGQLIMSMVLDHFGAVGFPSHPINLWRLAGAVLLVIGVILIRRF
jgi:transporter family-2 protein